MSFPAPIESVTRFLLPFCLRRASAAKAVNLLTSRPIFGAAGAWQEVAPHHYYQDELSPQAEALLLPSAGAGGGLDGAYVRLRQDLASRWFHGAEVVLREANSSRLSVEASSGIEVFLSGHGVGVLSCALRPTTGATTDRILDLNHLLSQLRRGDQARDLIRLPDPEADPQTWARIPETDRQRIRERGLPRPDAPLSEQVGQRGGRFSLGELLREALDPLSELGLAFDDSVLTVYTCLRFSSDHVDARSMSNEEWTQLAARLCQVEEAIHAGSAAEGFLPAHQWLNRNHLAAVAAQGSAHIVVDQPEVAFNEERLPRVRDKYFIPFLVTLLGRTLGRRIAAQAATISHTLGGAPGELDSLRRAVLDFSLSGLPAEVSTRAVVNHYYGMCRPALNAEDELARVNEALGHLDEFIAARRAEALSLRAAEAAEASRAMQANLEWIEIFLVFVYSSELAHLVWPMLHGDGVAVAEILGIAAFAVMASLLAAFVLRPWQHRRAGH